MVCGYQQVRYRIALRNPNCEIIHEEGPYDQLYSQAPVVQVSIPESEQLRQAQYFVAEVIFEDSSDHQLSTSKNISELH